MCPPFGDFFKKMFQLLILIAQKKCLGALNAAQKNHKSLLSTFSEKIMKNHQNVPKKGILGQN